MPNYELFNCDNMSFITPDRYDLIYCDMIYEDREFPDWMKKYARYLKPNAVMIVQTDYHTVADVWTFGRDGLGLLPLNWLTWKNEFGNFRKDRFRQCHDDILIFCNGNQWVWHPENVQIPKATAKAKGLNPSGRETKIATSVITDITLTTTAPERVKKSNGRCIRWQKPLKLYQRVCSPFLDPNHPKVLDPFGGTFSLGRWCIRNGYDYDGIELDPEVFSLGKANFEQELRND